MKNRSILGTVSILAPFVFSFAFAMDIYIPAVPQMVGIFHTSQLAVQVTLSIFMLIVGIAQLFIGPISDQYGRRKLALLSTSIYLVGSLFCALSPNIDVLIVSRAVQALGGSGMLVVALAIVRDCFSGNDSAKVYSFLNCGLATSPLFAPIIGSYLVVFFNWQAGFVFLTLLGMIILIISWFKIKETLSPENRIRVDLTLFGRYWRILRNREFIAYTISASAALSIFFTFFSSSPYIIIKLLHVSQQDFGYYFFIIGLTFFIGSLISGRIVSYFGVFKTVLIGAVIMTLAGMIMLGWYYYVGLTVANYLFPCMLAGIGGALMMGAGAGGAMEPFPDIAGSAAAVLGCIQFLSSALIGTFVMHWHVSSTIPLALTMLTMGSLSLYSLLKFL